MKPYYILEIKDLREDHIYTYNLTGVNASYFTRNDYKFKLEYFYFRPYYISKILKPTGRQLDGQALPQGEIFAIGDVLIDRGARKIIKYIEIDNEGKVIFRCRAFLRNIAVNSVSLENAVKYVELPIAEVVEQPPVVNNVFETIENQINQANLRKFRIQGILKNRGVQTLQEFAKFFFEEINNIEVESEATRNTIYIDDESVQTIRGKRRSLGDLYIIFKYYYPNCTLKEVIKLLYVTLPPLMPHLASCNCRQINKRVWFFDEERTNEYRQPDEADEYGHTKVSYIRLLNQ